MSDICVPWQQTRYCYAHEQCRLATRQWSRLLDSMLSVGLAKASPFCGPAVDPCLTRLVNSADDCESVSSRGSLAGRSDTAELRPACRHCCSEEDADTGARHAGWRRNGVTPWKSSAKMYSPGIKGYDIIQMMHGSEWDIEIWWTRGWKCSTRVQPECDIFNRWSYFSVERTTVLRMFCRMANH